MSTENITTDTAEIVGQLNYKGDVRGADHTVSYSERYGPVVPVMASYDEVADRTTLQFARVTR